MCSCDSLPRRAIVRQLAAAAAIGYVGRALPVHAATPFDLTEVADGVFVHLGAQEDFTEANEGGIANLALILGREQAAVVDTGGSLLEGRAFLAAIRRVTALPIGYVILTHAHPDHIFGNGAFIERDKPVFVGHARLPRAMAERGPIYRANMDPLMGAAIEGTSLVPPTRLVAMDRPEKIDLGGRALELRAWPTAHTDCDLTVFDARTRTLVAGDLVTVDRLPVVDGSITGWLDLMPDLAAIPAQRVVPGHGPVSPWPAALDADRAYLTGLRAAVRARMAEGVQIDRIVDLVPLPNDRPWLLSENVHPRNVIAVYKELEWE